MKVYGTIEYDYSKLKGRIVEKYGSCGSFSKDLGVSRVILSKKMNNKTRFTSDDISTITELLEIPIEEIGIYFFTQKVKQV